LTKTEINTADLTVVVQGPVATDYDMRYLPKHLRLILPGCKVIFSTTQPNLNSRLPDLGDFDEVVQSPDAGALPSLKWDGKPNNANRQRATTQAGLNKVETAFAIKLRSDSILRSANVIKYWDAINSVDRSPNGVGRGRILTTSFFSINPRLDERMPYHVSDIFQMGWAADLRRYWNGPAFPLGESLWYDIDSHAPRSTKREREFQARYAVEQWFCLNYLFTDQKFPIQYHNHIDANILADFERSLVDNFAIVHPRDIGLVMPRFDWAMRSIYFNALCYSFEDWKRLAKSSYNEEIRLSGYNPWPRNLFLKRLLTSTRQNRLGRLALDSVPNVFRRAIGR